ncbi:MAG: DsrE family protein [Desulfomonilaceae bacterium]
MRKYPSIVLFLLIAFGPVVAACADQSGTEKSETRGEHGQKMLAQAQIKCKVVFHLDWDQGERLVLALENIKNLFKEVPPQQCLVSVVANGKAVNLFRKDKVGERATDMTDLHKLGVSFKMCRNALAKNKIEKTDLFEVCEIVPAGILELINLQHEGFAYVKP